MKKCSIKICKEGDVIFLLAGLNLWKNYLLRMRNPQKLLENSKNLEFD
jgi:hypothetical protein